MKAAALICRLADGKMVSVGAKSLNPLIKKAKEVRESGKLDGKAVDRGIVVCSWRPAPAMKFAVKRYHAVKEARAKAAEEAKKAREAEAKAKAKAEKEAEKAAKAAEKGDKPAKPKGDK